MKLVNEILNYVLLGGYVVLKRNKDILISFSKLDQVATLETTYHKPEPFKKWRVDSICSSMYVKPTK